MWYRGPDLSLGLVNSAFVAAVEARDAAEVIARGSELIDSPGEESASAGAITALETGQPYIRNQPATIGGERRMLKLVDVPLPTGAVAGFAIDIQDLEDARFELARNIDSQRELADRMTAAVAQFELDRKLELLQPAVRGDERDRSRMARREARVRPRARAHARERAACPKCAISRRGRTSAAAGSLRPRS